MGACIDVSIDRCVPGNGMAISAAAATSNMVLVVQVVDAMHRVVHRAIRVIFATR